MKVRECDLECKDCLYHQMNCGEKEVCEYFYPVRFGQQEAIGVVEYRAYLEASRKRDAKLLEIIRNGDEP